MSSRLSVFRALVTFINDEHDQIPQFLNSLYSRSPIEYRGSHCSGFDWSDVHAGADYRFGFRAAGKASDLVELCEKYGLQSCIVEPVMDSKDSPPVDGSAKDKGQVSTTRIRKALAEGDMKRVAELLDRKYRLYIEVKDSIQTENVISLPIANVLNQPPAVGSYECSLCFEGSNDTDLPVLQARINETEISLESPDSSFVNKMSLQSRIALDFLA